MKTLITITLLIVTIIFSVYSALPIKSVVMNEAMTIEQACRVYQEMWDLDSTQAVSNLNRGRTEFKSGETFKYFELVGTQTQADGTIKEILLPEVDSGMLQVATGIYTCKEMAEQLQISLHIFKLANETLNCP